MRGTAWFWAWTLLAIGLGLESLALAYPAQEPILAYASTMLGIGTAYCVARGAFDFSRTPKMPVWAYAMLAAGGLGALAITSHTDLRMELLAGELALVPGITLMAVLLYPAARTARISGARTVCVISAILTAMLIRTLISGAILAAHQEQLSAVYWILEVVAGCTLAMVLAMGQIIAMLDEIRLELEDANGALSTAMQGLEVAAKTDPLTGLLNRYAFHAVLADLRRNRTLDGSIVVLDLNGLKRINDTFGHYAGDRALCSLALRLKEVVRASDYVFRWGGDEFVIMLFDVAPDVARERLAHMDPPDPLQLHGRAPVELTVSWGVAALTYDVESALKEADAQLYEQRRLIRNAMERIKPS